MMRAGSWVIGISLSRHSGLGPACLLAFVAAILIVGHASAFTDVDEDGMDDTWETDNGLDPTDRTDAALDPDSDKLNNLQEYKNWTDPNDVDTDNDLMDDGWEVRYGLDPLNATDAEKDKDGDGYSNLQEYRWQTDPADDKIPEAPCDDEGKDATMIFPVMFLFIIIGCIIVFLIIFGIYSKIKRDKLMDHETRKRIVEFIRENPGAYYTQIIGDLDLPHGVLTHHINMLESQEVIFSKQDRQYRRFYIDGMYGSGPLILGTQKAVLDEIRRHPGWSQSRIARKLDISRMVVSYHVNELERMSMISVSRDGRETQLFPVPIPGAGEGIAAPAAGGIPPSVGVEA
jgi:DNA-binding MarR family transcriptional regulator